MKAPAWSMVKLRLSWPPMPEPGNVLKFASGRRYQVMRVRGKTLHCMVLPEGQRVKGKVLPWMWSPRKRKVCK